MALGSGFTNRGGNNIHKAAESHLGVCDQDIDVAPKCGSQHNGVNNEIASWQFYLYISHRDWNVKIDN